MYLGMFRSRMELNLSFQVGQELCDHYSSIRENLQAASVTHAESLSKSSMRQLDVLIDQFSRPAPIRPKNVFDLNLASGASVSGLMLTYLIVMLQFKLSEGA